MTENPTCKKDGCLNLTKKFKLSKTQTHYSYCKRHRCLVNNCDDPRLYGYFWFYSCSNSVFWHNWDKHEMYKWCEYHGRLDEKGNPSGCLRCRNKERVLFGGVCKRCRRYRKACLYTEALVTLELVRRFSKGRKGGLGVILNNKPVKEIIWRYLEIHYKQRPPPKLFILGIGIDISSRTDIGNVSFLMPVSRLIEIGYGARDLIARSFPINIFIDRITDKEGKIKHNWVRVCKPISIDSFRNYNNNEDTSSRSPSIDYGRPDPTIIRTPSYIYHSSILSRYYFNREIWEPLINTLSHFMSDKAKGILKTILETIPETMPGDHQKEKLKFVCSEVLKDKLSPLELIEQWTS